MAGGQVYADVSMSLDGFITGPNDSVELPIGEGGDRLHRWIYDQESWRASHGQEGGATGTDDDVIGEAIDRAGAVVMGRRMFDHGEGPWGDEPPFHHQVFVLTHRGRDPLVKGETTFVFVTDGIDAAMERAKAAAGGKDVSVGGASAVRQYLDAGLLDEIQIHVVPILVGDGVRLFEPLGREPIELEPIGVVQGHGVAHLRYRVTNR